MLTLISLTRCSLVNFRKSGHAWADNSHRTIFSQEGGLVEAEILVVEKTYRNMCWPTHGSMKLAIFFIVTSNQHPDLFESSFHSFISYDDTYYVIFLIMIDDLNEDQG